MHENKIIRKKVSIATKLYDEHDIIYIGDVQNTINYLPEISRITLPVEILDIDTNITKKWENAYGLWLGSTFLLVRLMEYIVRKIRKKTKTTTSRRDKEKILNEIEQALKMKINILDVVQELKRIIAEKDISIIEIAKRADLDYSTLNKFLNKKRPENAAITKEYLLRICIALELNLSETNNVISHAGYFLSGKDRRDIVISVCIENKAGLVLINQILYEKGFKILK